MQMYVNYYDRHVITEPENPTIGVVLCKKNQALVEITLPKGDIHAREYQLYLPSKAQLRQKLGVDRKGWARRRGGDKETGRLL